MTNAWTWNQNATTVGLAFVAPTVPLSSNQANTMHWARRRARTDPWRDLLILLTRRNQTALLEWRGGRPVTIQVDLPFRDARTRDPHNYTGTVVKAVVDGMKVGGLIPDDSPEWATILDPTISVQRDKTKPLLAKVTIRARS